jgi:hypothetical protein
MLLHLAARLFLKCTKTYLHFGVCNHSIPEWFEVSQVVDVVIWTLYDQTQFRHEDGHGKVYDVSSPCCNPKTSNAAEEDVYINAQNIIRKLRG